MLDVTVCIGTYGGQEWRDLARERAIPSIRESGAPAWSWIHDDTLAEARNQAACAADTEWLAFLDADDSLEPGYFDVAGPQVDVIVPRVRYAYEDGQVLDPHHPHVVGTRGHHTHECESSCLAEGNFIVVGAPVRRSLFERVGGFRELPVYEDYDLWVRCWRAGARFGRVEGSVYRAHVNPQGRNQGLTAAARRAVQDAIVGEGW